MGINTSNYMINRSQQILDDHYAKHHLKGAHRRLAIGFLAVCAIVTLYAVLIISVCDGLCMFVPQ